MERVEDLKVEIARWVERNRVLEARLEAVRRAADAPVPAKLVDPLGVSPRRHEVHVRAVDAFAQAMVEKLDRNAHKGHWEACSPEYLLRRIDEELTELRAALRSGKPEQIKAEAVDVANFAMFFFDRA